MKMLVRGVILVVAAAIGIKVADWVLDDVSVSWVSLLWVALIFTVLQALLAPIVERLATDKAPALLGGIGAASSFIALVLTALFTSNDKFWIHGVLSWVWAAVIVWLVTMLATLLLPVVIRALGGDKYVERT
jgi:hypothetical protein